jgi:hypothetical protein
MFRGFHTRARRAPTRAQHWLVLCIVVVVSCLASAATQGVPTAAAANFTAAQNADLLLGATSFTSMAYGDGTAMLRGMYYPNGVAVDAGGSVYVADTSNYRVTRWNAPATDGENFSNELMKLATASPSMKQAWYSTLLEGTNDTQGIAVSGDGATTALAIADRSHNRIVLSKGETTTDTETSSLGTSRFVLGQPNFSSNGSG